MAIVIRQSADLQQLGAATADVLAAGAEESFFCSRDWFRLVVAHGLAPGRRPWFVAAERYGVVTALLALARGPDGVSGLECPYTCLYAPLFAPGMPEADPAELLRALRTCASLRLDALDPSKESTRRLLTAASAAGWRVRMFEHFGTWYEEIGAGGWDEYLAARPGPLRSTVRRKLARMARDGGAVDIVSGGDRLEAAIAAYEDVYERSWKPAEPFPTFNPALMRVLAASGRLRLGIYRLDGRPMAAQFWLVEHGRATVLKLAHDDAAREASPGTVLTALMLRQLIDAEGARAIDFGRGDDDYKRLWASRRRQMVGLLLINPRRVRGLALLARELAAQVVRRFRRGAASRPASA